MIGTIETLHLNRARQPEPSDTPAPTGNDCTVGNIPVWHLSRCPERVQQGASSELPLRGAPATPLVELLRYPVPWSEAIFSDVVRAVAHHIWRIELYFRLAFFLVAAALSVPSAAFAGYYSTTRCNGPHFEAYILKRLGAGIMMATNRPATNHVKYGPLLSSTLVANTGDSLTCEITVQYGIHQLHGRFSSTRSARGFSWKWMPNY